MSDAGRVLRLLGNEGPAPVWWRVLERTVYRRLRFLTRPVEFSGPPRPAPALGSLEFSQLDPGEIDAYGRLRPDVPEAETRRRLEAGERCLVALRAGELIHARWFARERVQIPYLGHSFELEPSVVYAYDGFTAPEARRQLVGLGGPAPDAVIGDWGARATIVSVWPENTAGANLAIRLGYEPIGTVAAWRAGTRRLRLIRRLEAGYLGPASPL